MEGSVTSETKKSELEKLLEKFTQHTTAILPPGVTVGIGDNIEKAIKAMLDHVEAGEKL